MSWKNIPPLPVCYIAFSESHMSSSTIFDIQKLSCSSWERPHSPDQWDSLNDHDNCTSRRQTLPQIPLHTGHIRVRFPPPHSLQFFEKCPKLHLTKQVEQQMCFTCAAASGIVCWDPLSAGDLSSGSILVVSGTRLKRLHLRTVIWHVQTHDTRKHMLWYAYADLDKLRRGFFLLGKWSDPQKRSRTTYE